MFPWWPKSIPTTHVLSLARLGRRKIRFCKGHQGYGYLLGPNGQLGERVATERSATMIWNGGALSLAEQRAIKAISTPVVFALARILGDGPRLFRLPIDLVASLDHVELTLAVKDFAPPFPSCIVAHPNGEYHFVAFEPEEGYLHVVTVGPDNVCDYVSMLQPQQCIEEYLCAGDIYHHLSSDRGEVTLKVPTDDDWKQHRFRATLNFLLLATMEGQICVQRADSQRRRAYSPPMKVACPSVYEIQNIKLFCAKTQAALRLVEPHGGTVRPHFRRSHWRRVAIGHGRCERRLVLIPWCFVNKSRLTEPADLPKTHYTAE